jgi:outer membrane protein OmpA-like peptidoglycan-associated protein
MMDVVVVITWIGMLVASILHTPSTTVVLGDNAKEHNAIIVSTNAGKVVVDKPGEYVSLTSKDKAPSEIKVMSKEQINKKFQSAIQSAPLKPIKILLYFKSGTNELTELSKEKLPQILKSIQERMPCDVNIIGHTDTQGSLAYNAKLSLQRADFVKEWIQENNVKLDNLKVETYGETDLLIPTGDNVSEPRNRRVELLIR